MLEKDNANLKAKVEELQGQLNAANRTLDGVTSVHPALKNFLSFAPDELLELPSTTGEAVPLAFAVHAPVRRDDGTAEFQHWGGVVQEESTSDEAMNALEGFMQLLCLHVTRTADPSGAAQCSNNTQMDDAARKSCAEPLHRLLRALCTGRPAPGAVSHGQPGDGGADGKPLSAAERKILLVPWAMTEMVKKLWWPHRSGGLQMRIATALGGPRSHSEALFLDLGLT